MAPQAEVAEALDRAFNRTGVTPPEAEQPQDTFRAVEVAPATGYAAVSNAGNVVYPDRGLSAAVAQQFMPGTAA